MSRRKTNDVASLIFITIILIKYVGIKESINMLYQIVKIFNTFLQQFYNISVLSFVFKNLIVFPIISIIFSIICCPRGKTGSIIGRILYSIVAYIVCLILDNLAIVIF